MKSYICKVLIRFIHILACTLIPYLISALIPGVKWKTEQICRLILEHLTGEKFISVRPEWLKNPMTSKNLELDCYNDKLKIALEYNGKQHYEYTPCFHRDMESFQLQVYRDALKKSLCDIRGIHLIIVPYTISKYHLTGYILDKLMRISKHRKEHKI